MHRVAGGGGGGGRSAYESPIDSLETVVNKGDYNMVKQKCQLLLRDLAIEKNYHTLLDKFLGFHSLQGVRPFGGWMLRSRVPPKGSNISDLDTRFALLTGHKDYQWNIYNFLVLMSGDSARDLQMDTQCLPPRTQEFFNGRSPELLEQFSTDSGKRLYEQIFYSRTLPHARSTNSGGGSRGGGGGGGGGASITTAAGGASQGGINNTTVTRLPFIVSMLDHYHYCFALWPAMRKYWPIEASSRGGFTSSSLQKEENAFQLDLAQGLVTAQTIASSKGVYYQLLVSYLENYFVREATPALQKKNVPLDVQKALHMSDNAERFLRIFIEVWLEWNMVQNPNMKPQAEPSDVENHMYSNKTYDVPGTDVLQGLLVLVNFLLARKVEVDLAIQANPRSARAFSSTTIYCPALTALQQPLFIFLSLAFRNLRVSSSDRWTQFLLVVDLWLAVLNPDQALLRTFPDQKDNEASVGRWREDSLREYVASNFHFYTTLFVLFMRKARELLAADSSRQPLLLQVVERVMKTFHQTALRDVLLSVSKSAGELWQARNQLRGRDYMLFHLRSLRLLRSRPCLLTDACQDAHHLAAELLAVRRRAAKALDDRERSGVVRTAMGWLASMSGTTDTGGIPVGTEADLIVRIDAVLEEVYGIFPSVQARCQRPVDDESSSVRNRDADRRGVLLTNNGREQLLLGLRNCDPTKAKYLGDPLFNPEVGSHESVWLLKLVQALSISLSKYFYPAWSPPAERVPGDDQIVEYTRGFVDGGGHVVVREVSPTELAPINLRPLADVTCWRYMGSAGMVCFVAWAILVFLKSVGDVIPVL